MEPTRTDEVRELSYLRYSARRHRRFEKHAKDVVKRMAATWGLQVLQNDDERVVAEIRSRLQDPEWQPGPVDLYVTDIPVWDDANQRVVLLEVETRADDHFSYLFHYHKCHSAGERDVPSKYSTVHVPFRKEINGNISDLYIGINESCTRYFLMEMENVHRFAELGPVLQNSSDNEGGTVDDEPYIEIPNTLEYVEYNDVPEGCGLTPMSQDWIDV